MRFIKRHKKAFVVGLALLCLAAMAAAGLNKINSRFFGNVLGKVVTPVEGAFETARRKVAGFFAYVGGIGDLARENAELRAENERLKAEANLYVMAKQDNEKLAALLSLSEEYADLPVIGAEIAAKDPGNWYNAYYVSKGAADGVKRNMIALSGGGLAGRVTEVYDDYAKITSLIDDTSSIAARTARTGDAGFVMGDVFLMRDGLCKMTMIPEEADVVVGDKVVTGRLSTIYPPNIAIGEIMSVTRAVDGTQSAIVRPFADFAYIETVLIVTELFENAFARDEE